MNPTAIISLAAIGACLSCQNKTASAVFEIPDIVNSQFSDTVTSKPFKARYLSEVSPGFVGKYKFQKEIDINPENRDTTTYKDFIEGYSPARIQISDSIDVNGFELIVDYEKTVRYNPFYEQGSKLFDHYPVYFVNSTHTDKMFFGKDSYVFGIQEALSPDNWGEWRPIEGRGFDFCGNGRFGVIVHPNEFVLVLMRKYEGDFKTALRVRIEVGNSVYVSKPFVGMIDECQFEIKNDSYLESRLQETNGKAAAWLFYGAVPKQEEWAVMAY